MESKNPTLPDVLLFEGQEGFAPSGAFSAAVSKPSFPLQDHAYGRASEKVYEAWAAGEVLGRPSSSDTEDLLQFLINPNDIYESRRPVASPESDSGISDDPHADPPLQSELGPPNLSATVIYEVICDMGMVEEATGPDPVFSNPLENWTSPAILPEACVMSEVSLGLLENVTRSNMEDIPMPQDTFEPLQLQGLYLTEEEKRLLSEEGVLLCSDLPLTKAEERILKKVRRKIRNKQSAQDSRRRKKEYIDGLESRVAACSVQNQELRKKVQELETHNMSLVGQLQKLQGLIKQTSTKAAQTSTCLVILVFSLGLFILPSCSSFLGGTQVSRVDYKPSGVISRHILTKGSLSDPDESPTTRSPESPRVQMEEPREDPGASDGDPAAAGNPDTVRETMIANTSDPGSPSNVKEANARRPQPEKDLKKQMHADEM
ncbi:cyclic AMP-responsive element-binding protein 3-like protein 4 [Lacerta agilis]|uniref:cyclic AMP-responsive element-binding protein 3-like protein 4 n=1 Tax=Lacerta agilis TaxID=80427 RepID=UPI0014195DA3|nr:cyclic AMP-responsive element-binding protein 3-like protein 4 [Lacerta agilis]